MEESKKFLEDLINDRLDPFFGEIKKTNKKETVNIKLILFIYLAFCLLLIFSFFMKKETKIKK